MHALNLQVGDNAQDRKSTRLNSSHSSISYAVFCLKKKNGLMKFNNDKRRSPFDSDMNNWQPHIDFTFAATPKTAIHDSYELFSQLSRSTLYIHTCIAHSVHTHITGGYFVVSVRFAGDSSLL